MKTVAIAAHVTATKAPAPPVEDRQAGPPAEAPGYAAQQAEVEAARQRDEALAQAIARLARGAPEGETWLAAHDGTLILPVAGPVPESEDRLVAVDRQHLEGLEAEIADLKEKVRACEEFSLARQSEAVQLREQSAREQGRARGLEQALHSLLRQLTER